MTFANLDSCHFSSLYIIHTAPFLLMGCHTRINKYADSWICCNESTPLQLEDLVALTILVATHSNWWNRLFICVIFKNLGQMRYWVNEMSVYVCVCVCVCVRQSASQRGVTRKQPYTMAPKTWAARHWTSPKQTRGDVKGCIITTWNQRRIWN